MNLLLCVVEDVDVDLCDVQVLSAISSGLAC